MKSLNICIVGQCGFEMEVIWPAWVSIRRHVLKRHVFVAALFTRARTYKQPKCPSKKEWIKKMCYTYTEHHYSAIKKEWNNAICNNMGGPSVCHTEWSQKNKYRILRNISGKIGIRWSYLQSRSRDTGVENTHMDRKGLKGGEMHWDTGWHIHATM